MSSMESTNPIPKRLAITLTLLWLSCSLVVAQASESGANSSQLLRFWLDEYAFGTGETSLLEEAVAREPGAEVAGRTQTRFFTTKGFQAPGKWDVYWTSTKCCLAAYKRKLQPHHLVSCLPGTEVITEKSWLFATLEAAFGSAAAARISPLAFTLPRQYFQLAQTVRQGAASSWVLKEEVHQGRGVHVTPAATLLSTSLQRSNGKVRFRLAQQLVTNQLLVNDRPFYIRAWILVFGSNPVRAYLFDGGVVVFGQQRSAPSQQQQGQGGGADDLIVNLWRQDRKSADPWSLQQLRDHLDSHPAWGPGTSQAVWQQIQAAVAATVASAVPRMRRASARLAGYRPQSTGFAVFGADFVLDATLKPWLIEMNAFPSLARKVITAAKNSTACGASSGGSSAGGLNPFDEEKSRFIEGMLSIMLARHEARLQQQQQQQQTSEGVAPAPAQQAENEVQQALALICSEAAAAVASSFADVTPAVYQALDCLAGPRGNDSCTALDGLPVGMPTGQQCSASASGWQAWFQGWQAWLGHCLHVLPPITWSEALRKPVKQQAVRFKHSDWDSHYSMGSSACALHPSTL